jgi:hypothetical protein
MANRLALFYTPSRWVCLQRQALQKLRRKRHFIALVGFFAK